MKLMGALQPGIPSPTTIPQNWHIIIIDLQDCFFNIPLHSLDWERFAFSLSYLNHIGPHKWYQWTVLPQGMMNSPTMCQYYLAEALEPVRKQFPDFLIIHYMDDIFFSSICLRNSTHVWYSSTILKKLWINHYPWKNSNLYTLSFLRISF